MVRPSSSELEASLYSFQAYVGRNVQLSVERLGPCFLEMVLDC
jgi:hypothetical protein